MKIETVKNLQYVLVFNSERLKDKEWIEKLYNIGFDKNSKYLISKCKQLSLWHKDGRCPTDLGNLLLYCKSKLSFEWIRKRLKLEKIAKKLKISSEYSLTTCSKLSSIDYKEFDDKFTNLYYYDIEYKKFLQSCNFTSNILVEGLIVKSLKDLPEQLWANNGKAVSLQMLALFLQLWCIENKKQCNISIENIYNCVKKSKRFSFSPGTSIWEIQLYDSEK